MKVRFFTPLVLSFALALCILPAEAAKRPQERGKEAEGGISDSAPIHQDNPAVPGSKLEETSGHSRKNNGISLSESSGNSLNKSNGNSRSKVNGPLSAKYSPAQDIAAVQQTAETDSAAALWSGVRRHPVSSWRSLGGSSASSDHAATGASIRGGEGRALLSSTASLTYRLMGGQAGRVGEAKAKVTIASAFPLPEKAGPSAFGTIGKQAAFSKTAKLAVVIANPGSPATLAASSGGYTRSQAASSDSDMAEKPAGEEAEKTVIELNPGELDILARIIYAEARGESYEGQVAVGAVVINRVKSPHFPDTIREVVFQRGAFTAVHDGQYRLKPGVAAYRAAREALRGTDPTGNAVYYYNPDTATSRWIRSRAATKRIGNHLFAQ
ncbi:cell wall hydrolase [Gorillibacterium timonense]|uniref:cell wall hydrolase n=1 Tax=Gorillibacterium timonense TaxID=1689269 RepID=UPI00071DAA33|nr:cell wall hydrolase [Gorillibacterium timonense]